MNRYTVELEPSEVDKLVATNIKELIAAVKQDKELWGEDNKKDLKALKRVLKMYEW